MSILLYFPHFSCVQLQSSLNVSLIPVGLEWRFFSFLTSSTFISRYFLLSKQAPKIVIFNNKNEASGPQWSDIFTLLSKKCKKKSSEIHKTCVVDVMTVCVVMLEFYRFFLIETYVSWKWGKQLKILNKQKKQVLIQENLLSYNLSLKTVCGLNAFNLLG